MMLGLGNKKKSIRQDSREKYIELGHSHDLTILQIAVARPIDLLISRLSSLANTTTTTTTTTHLSTRPNLYSLYPILLISTRQTQPISTPLTISLPDPISLYPSPYLYQVQPLSTTPLPIFTGPNLSLPFSLSLPGPTYLYPSPYLYRAQPLFTHLYQTVPLSTPLLIFLPGPASL